MLQCKNLHFSYYKETLLTDISLDFNKAEFVGLIGANGTGKSTLLQLLLGLLQPQSGEVQLNKVPLPTIKRKNIAKTLAFVPQSIELPFAFSVEQIVAMGRNPYLGAFELESALDKNIIADAIAQVDLTNLSSRMVNTLSGGERQRVIIARALAQQADIILFDEPIASLDICHQIATLDLIKQLTEQGKIAICALHDLNFAAKYCQRLILMGEINGSKTVIADGTPQAVLTNENLKRYFSISATLNHNKNQLQLSNIKSLLNSMKG